MSTATPTCAACGARPQPGFRFCGQCGAPLGATPVSAGPSPAPSASAAGVTGAVRLVVVRGDGMPAHAIDLPDGETVCGRTEGAIRLADDPAVSPRHARFTLSRSVLALEDLGSTNGTFVRIRGPHRLAPGDLLRVGRQLLRLEQLPRPAEPDASGVRAWGSPEPGSRLRLVQLLEGGGVGDVFPLRRGDNALGRDAGDLVFPADRYVSARHALLEVSGDAVTIVDVGSSNGTFVRISGETELAPGDQLLVGAQLLRVDA